MSHVHTDLRPLRRFRKQIKADLEQNTQGPIRRALKKWAARYRSFAQLRFDKYSKGGGDWAPLKEGTKRGRRAGKRGSRTGKGRLGKVGVAQLAAKALKRGKRGGLISILRDTSDLFGALDPVWHGNPGGLEQDIPFGVRVGFGGQARHESAPMTIADLAEIHHSGKGNVPARKIIVDLTPDQPGAVRTISGMTTDMNVALVELLGEVGDAD